MAEDVRVSAKKYLDKVAIDLQKAGGVLRSDLNKARFTELTGGPLVKSKGPPVVLYDSRHDWLLDQWKTKKTTTCMEFVIEYAKQLGYPRHIPGGYMGSFYVDTNLATLKPPRGHAWVPNGPGKKPKDGDVILFSNETNHEHIGVNYTIDEQDNWVTFESGQGTIGSFDAILRKEQKWGSRTVKGWVDLELYFGPVPAPGGTAKPADGKTTMLGPDDADRAIWLTADGEVIHPDSPDGGGGPGFFRIVRAMGMQAGHDDPHHPRSPRTWSMDPLDLQDFIDENEEG